MKYINSINYYRGIAIIIIVASHCYSLSGIKFDSFIENFIKNLIAGGTINFVFISGFLFYYVFFRRFNYLRFLKSKAKKVLMPYLVLSIPAILFNFYRNLDFLLENNFENSLIEGYILPFLKYIFSGAHLLAYWYIPFIMLVFLMSPLHIIFIRLRLRYQGVIIIFLIFVSVFIHRPYERQYVFQAIQSLLYFTPVYLFGIVCSIHKEKIYSLLKNKEFLLLIVVVGLAFLQTYLGYYGNYNRNLNYSINWVIDIVFIQKIFMCLFFMIWLNRFENRTNFYFNTLAKYSFSIFFLHSYLLTFLYYFYTNFGLKFDYPWIMFIIFTFLLIITSILLARLVVQIFPKYSIIIIGFSKKKLK